MAHPIGLSHLTIFEASPPEAVDIAARLGFAGVGFRLLPAAPGEIVFPLIEDRALLAETTRRLRETGIAATDVEIVRLKPETDIETTRAMLETAAALGARHVLVAADDPDRARLSDNFAAFASLAASFGLTADLEFMPWTQVPDIATALAVVAASTSGNAGILVDNLHVSRSGASMEEVRALPRQLLHYAQICDAEAAFSSEVDALVHVARNERLLPGEGGLDLASFILALPEDITISVEVPQRQLARSVPPEERARRAMAATRCVIEAAGRRWLEAG